MEKQNIYQDISARTGGEIYLGVVGPVRSGKSTFIKRFMNARERWMNFRKVEQGK